jgi:DNA-binding response OmpR family regulator
MRIICLESPSMPMESASRWLRRQGYNVLVKHSLTSLEEVRPNENRDLLLVGPQASADESTSVFRYLNDRYRNIAKVIMVLNRYSINLDALKNFPNTSVLPYSADHTAIADCIRERLYAARCSKNLRHLVLGHVTLDKKYGKVTVDGSVVNLTPKDFQLASCLMDNVGRMLSRAFLLREVWGINAQLNTRTVDVHVSRVRKTLQLVPERGFKVKTVYQYGYCLDEI